MLHIFCVKETHEINGSCYQAGSWYQAGCITKHARQSSHIMAWFGRNFVVVKIDARPLHYESCLWCVYWISSWSGMYLCTDKCCRWSYRILLISLDYGPLNSCVTNSTKQHAVIYELYQVIYRSMWHEELQQLDYLYAMCVEVFTYCKHVLVVLGMDKWFHTR